MTNCGESPDFGPLILLVDVICAAYAGIWLFKLRSIKSELAQGEVLTRGKAPTEVLSFVTLISALIFILPALSVLVFGGSFPSLPVWLLLVFLLALAAVPVWASWAWTKFEAIQPTQSSEHQLLGLDSSRDSANGHL